MNALQIIQQKLKAPKTQRNDYGGYNYRNQEDILEAVKPLLAETNSMLVIADEIVEIGGQIFVKAFAELSQQIDAEHVEVWGVTAYAKHADQQKGMNDAQITGSTSSYARKYALNGLFLIDDARDPDTLKPEEKVEKKPQPKKVAVAQGNKPELTPSSKEWKTAKEKVMSGTPLEKVKAFFNLSPENEKLLTQ